MELRKDFTPELDSLNEEFQSDFAIISSIRDNDYEVVAVASQLPTIKAGDHFETQNTYCNEVVNSQKTVVYEHVGKIKAMVLHPIYTAMQLESYIGEPIRWQGDVIGTLNFSAFDPKKPTFSESDVEKVQALARAIEAEIDPQSV